MSLVLNISKIVYLDLWFLKAAQESYNEYINFTYLTHQISPDKYYFNNDNNNENDKCVYPSQQNRKSPTLTTTQIIHSYKHFCPNVV